MFKGITGAALNADALVKEYHGWANGALLHQTDTKNGPRFIGELRAVSSQLARFAKQARDLMADQDFSALTADMQDNVTMIAEEGETGVTELDDEVNPDKKFAKLDVGAKHDATARVLADQNPIDRLRARARMEVRAQQPQKPPKK